MYPFHKKLSLLDLAAALLVGFNPWFLQNLSFRFNCSYMTLSLLFSVISFLFSNKNKVLFLAVSILSIFLMYNTYQASSGIYVVMVLALSLKQLLDNQSFGDVFKKSLVAMISYISAMFLCLIGTKFNPGIATRGGMITIASIKNIPKTILVNNQMYLSKITNQRTKLCILLVFILVILWIKIQSCVYLKVVVLSNL